MPKRNQYASEISSMPELACLAPEGQAVSAPLLAPRPRAAGHRHPKTAAALAVVARTAGALASDIPFPGIEAERAAAEAAMAEAARRER